MERLLGLPHEEPLDEALLRLVVHAGTPAQALNAYELREDLRWMCRQLWLLPPSASGGSCASACLPCRPDRALPDSKGRFFVCRKALRGVECAA